MFRPSLRFVLVVATLALATGASRTTAQPLQSGDIVVPGHDGVDNLGNIRGCIYRIRDGVATSGGTDRKSTLGVAAGAGSDTRLLHLGQPVELNWYTGTTAVGDDPGVGALRIGPVPARGDVHIAFTAPASGASARLEVVDLAGRRVAVPVDGHVGGGVNAVRWSGTGADGPRLSPGVYYARFELDGRREARRMVVVQ